MGSFEEHMRYGVAAYALAVTLAGGVVGYLAYAGYLSGGSLALAAVAAVAGFPFAVAGAGFPDIDHHAAKPHRFLRKWVSVVAAVGAAYVLFASGVAADAGGAAVSELTAASVVPEPVVGGGVSFLGGLAAGAAAYVGVAVIKPPHRGVTHTLTTGVVVAAGVGVAVGYAAAVGTGAVLASPPFAPSAAGVVAGGIAAAAFFVGFLSHLQCDGLLVGFLPDAM
jgi:hypothetical protein